MAKKGFVFYDNWCDMLEQLAANDKSDIAGKLAYAIVHLYYTGELLDLGDFYLNMMLQNTITPGIEAQQDHYVEGKRGGRAKKLSEEDNETIAKLRYQGTKQVDIAKQFGVSTDTISRSKGWLDYLSYIAPRPQIPQKSAKPNSAVMRSDIDILHDILNDKDIPDF